MLDLLARNWWTFALRGVVAIVFGALALLVPMWTLTAFVIAFGAFLLIDGAGSVIAAVRRRKTQERWWVLLLIGLFTLAAGGAALALPGLTAFMLVILAAVWVIGVGLMEIVAGFQLRKVIKGEWVLFLSGAFGVAFGVFLAMRPAAGAVALIYALGLYSVVVGVMRVALALRVRRTARRVMIERGGPVPAPA